MFYKLITACAIIIFLLAISAKSQAQCPTVDSWEPQNNRTIWITVKGEIRVYIAELIEPCRGNEMGWVLITSDSTPYCYTVGARIGTIKNGMFVPFIKKTSKER